MLLEQPQLDLPKGLRGGSDTWDQPQASFLLAAEWFGPEVGSWGSGAWSARSWGTGFGLFAAAVSEDAAAVSGLQTQSAFSLGAVEGVQASSSAGAGISGTQLVGDGASATTAVAGSSLYLPLTSDSIGAQEAVLSAPAFFRSTSEAVQGQPGFAATQGFFGAVSNGASAFTESFSLRTVQPGSWGAGTWGYGPWGSQFAVFEAFLAEGVTAYETPSAASGNLRAVSETGVTTELVGAGFSVRSSTVGQGTGASSGGAGALQTAGVFGFAAAGQTFSGLPVINREVFAAAEAREALQAQSFGSFQVATSAAAAAGPALLPGLVYFVALAQGVAILDRAWAAYLWNPLSDAQSPGWQGPAAAPAGAWTPVSDNQAANWQNVLDAQSGLWVPVVDAQEAPWGPININP